MASPTLKLVLVALCLAVIGSTSGCQRAEKPIANHAQPATFLKPLTKTTPEHSQRIAGCDSTTIFAGMWDGNIIMLIWTDVPFSDSYLFTAGDHQSAKFSGYLLPPSQPRIDFACQITQQGSAGTMEIDGKNFDLADGRLFLAATISGKTLVAQHQHDLSSIGHGKGAFDQWCQESGFRGWYDHDPKIREFFDRSDAAK